MFVGFHLSFLVIILLGVLALVLLTPQAVKRFALFGRAKVNKAAKAVEATDPEAVYEERINEAAHQLAGNKEQLAKVQAVVTGLKRQLDTAQQEADVLVARIKKHQTANTAESNDAAAQYAEQLNSVEAQIASLKTSIANHDKTYQQLHKSTTDLQVKIKNARQEAERLGTELQASKLEVSLGNLEKEMSGSGAGLGDKDLAHLKESFQSKIDQNHAQANLATEKDPLAELEARDAEAERKAKVQATLDRLKKEEAGNSAANH